MTQIQSLAVEPASIETTSWRSSRYKHWVNGFIVDGDYWLVKVNKRTLLRTNEYVWNNVVPPFEVPEGEGIPTLVNPDDPFYVWEKKPEQWHPCWFRWEIASLTITDMVTGEKIGRGVACPANAFVYTGKDGLPWDDWWKFRAMVANQFRKMGLGVTEVSQANKNQVLLGARSADYYHGMAHGGYLNLTLDPNNIEASTVWAAEMGRFLYARPPLVFAFASHCDAMAEKGPGTWSHVFTKNTIGHVVVGFKSVGEATGTTWSYGYKWIERFYDYFVQSYSAVAAFEESVVDYPQIAPIVDIYEGTSPTPVEFQDLSIQIEPMGRGYTNPQSGIYNKEVKITAYPNPGYKFSHWDIFYPGYSSIGTQPEIQLDTRRVAWQLVAHFKEAPLPTHSLTIALSPSEGGYTNPLPGAYTYPVGARIDVYVYPNPGYILERLNVIRNGQEEDITNYPSGLMYSLTSLDKDTKITAYFKQKVLKEYTLTMVVSPQGSGTTSPSKGSHTIREGTTLTIDAYPNTGYVFDYWRLVAGDVDQTYPYSHGEFMMPNGNTQLTAYFKAVEKPPEEVAQYSLTVAVSPPSSGRTSPFVGIYSFAKNTMVYLDAFANPGYEFEYWEDEDRNRVYSHYAQLLMEKAHTVTAHFKATAVKQYTLTIEILGVGSVTPAGGVYAEGEVVQLAAYPAEGWLFNKWEGTNSDTTNPTTVTMNQNRHVVAVFLEKVEGEPPEERPEEPPEERPSLPELTTLLGPMILMVMMGAMAKMVK